MKASLLGIYSTAALSERIGELFLAEQNKTTEKQWMLPKFTGLDLPEIFWSSL